MNIRRNGKTDKRYTQGGKGRTEKNGKPEQRSGARDDNREQRPARSGSQRGPERGEQSSRSSERPERGERPSRSHERPERGERPSRSYERPERGGHSSRSHERPERGERSSYRMEEQADNLRLEGRNAVMEALNAGKTIDKVLVKKGEVEGTLRVIVAKARDAGIVVQEVSRQKLDEMAQSGNHQGVIAMCPAHEYAEVSDILAKAKARGEQPFIVILDGITDTHNLGAIIRSADAAGAHGVIIPKHRAAGLTGIVSKTSAGALQYVLVSKVVNISRTIEELKDKGIWVAAADMKGESLYAAPLDGPIALVIGGEGEGAGRLVREKCDFVVKIPMRGKIASLNASVAAGILMYEVVRRRHYSE